MKANIAKKVLLCTLSAALLAAPCAGVSAAGTGAGTKAASSGSSITAEVEEIVTANAWVGSDDNSGSGSSVTVAQVPVTSSVGGVKSSLPGVYLATSVRGTAITSGLTQESTTWTARRVILRRHASTMRLQLWARLPVRPSTWRSARWHPVSSACFRQTGQRSP